MATKPSTEHWQEYTNLQKTKHDLIREYLNGWLPKLGFWSGRLLYFDTHAGRGRFETGEAGSPLVALTTLLEHSSRDQILANSEAHYFFIEEDENSAAALRSELASLGELPQRMTHEVIVGNCFEAMSEVVAQLESEGSTMAPAFIFVDPFGFKVPMELQARLLRAGRVELFVNVMWRELDMGVVQGRRSPDGGWGPTLDFVFGTRDWISRLDGEDSEERAEQAIALLTEAVGARWSTPIRMMNVARTRYFLIHFSNHDEGRDLMKACTWKVCPDGSFRVGRSDDGGQLTLLEVQPDLAPLRAWFLAQLAEGPVRNEELDRRLRHEPWLRTQMRNLIRELRTSKQIEASGYDGRFSFGANPLFSLAETS